MTTTTEPANQDILDREPEEIATRAEGLGRSRLDRSNLDIFITGLIGGAEVSIGGLAAMAVMGAALTAVPRIGLYGALALGGLIFPVGFLFVIGGRSELFTENFLIPVVAVINGERTIRSLVELWGFSWLGNILGCAAMALLLSQPKVIGDPILAGYRAYSAYKLSLPLASIFWSGALAGMVMTALTWLLVAVQDSVGKIIAVWAAGYVLFAANLSHSMVGSSLLFVGFRLAGHSLGETVAWILVATAGNLAGGVSLVTLFRIVQAKEKQRRH